MYTITKQFHFSASHRLDGLPEGHPCGRLHGHNYIVEVALQSATLNTAGFVRDYGDLRSIQRYIDTVLDHHHLNDVLGFQPSAENLARHMFETFKDEYPELMSVRVSETPKTWAEYRPGAFTSEASHEGWMVQATGEMTMTGKLIISAEGQ